MIHFRQREPDRIEENPAEEEVLQQRREPRCKAVDKLYRLMQGYTTILRSPIQTRSANVEKKEIPDENQEKRATEADEGKEIGRKEMERRKVKVQFNPTITKKTYFKSSREN